MTTRATIKWNEAELRQFLGSRGDLDQAMSRASGRIRDRAKINVTQAGLVDTGLLRQSLSYQRERADGRSIVWVIGTNVPYAKYHEFGTGPWIYPARAKVLRFLPRGGGVYVFARRVRGVPATAFLKNAVQATTPSDFMV